MLYIRMTTRKLVRVIVDLVVLGVFVFVGLNYQSLADQYALTHYRPTADVSAYMAAISLTTQGKAIFYRANPVYDYKATFNNDCQTQVGELELGCFYRNRIFVLRIENPDLAPETDVVASHELLHAVWDRMSTTERKEIGDALESVYKSLNDPELKARISSYATSEPGQEANELHSILGTEQSVLTPALEAHYAKYFVNRQQIAARQSQYKSVFDGRKAQLDSDLARIRSLKSQLNYINAQMDADKQAGDIPAYNALVPRQNALVAQVNQLITDYHAAVDEYNSLSKALDSQQIQPGE